MRRFFEDGARGLDGIFDAMEAGNGAGAERGGVHDDGVAFDVAVEIEMRAVAGVEGGIVFEDGDRGLDGVEGVAAAGKNAPAGLKRAKAAGLAGVDGLVGDIPGTAVNDERGPWHVGINEHNRSGKKFFSDAASLPESAAVIGAFSFLGGGFVIESGRCSGAECMQAVILSGLFEISRTVVSMCFAGVALFFIGVWARRKEIAEGHGLDKVVALSTLCFGIPLAVFGAEHLSAARGIMQGVPAFMPWRLFWAYFVGVALLAASLSIVTKTQVQWSGLLFGIMMFLFEAMIHIPRALASPHERIPWTIVFREMSFGGAGWVLAGNAMDAWRGRGKGVLINVGRVLIGLTALFFGVQHFLHPTGLPGVPLEKQMAAWIPGRALIDYVTGAGLLVGGVSFLLNRKTRTVATCLGGWILLTVLVIYGPVLVAGLMDPSTEVEVEGINYFADTLLFAGVILAVGGATPREKQPARPGA